MSFSAIRSLAKAAKILPSVSTAFANNCVSKVIIPNTRTLTRSLYFLCRRQDSSDSYGHKSVTAPWSRGCGCGCSIHTKDDKELAAFLEEEIANETKASSLTVPQLEGFDIKYEESSVTLTRKLGNETITIKSNVNHSVDAEETVSDPNDPKEAEGEMKAKPDFTVEIAKGGKILSFHCVFSQPEEEEVGPGESYNDSFQITEIALYEGEFKETTYSVSGDIMDGYLYDLLMNYLEARGVSNEFADKMVTFFTAYEHRLYINLLQNLKKFVEK